MQNILGGGITRNKSPEEGKQKWIQLNLLAERKSETELVLYVGAIWKDSVRQVQAVPLICETESLLLALKRQGTASCILGSSLCQCIQNWKATSREASYEAIVITQRRGKGAWPVEVRGMKRKGLWQRESRTLSECSGVGVGSEASLEGLQNFKPGYQKDGY